MSKQIDETIPRRIRVDQNTPAELAIRAAVDAVEHAGAHPLLTDAVVLLGEAREKVADFVDGFETKPPLGFLEMVRAELTKARHKHSTPIHNAHEAFAVIYEELDEFWDEVRAQKHDKEKMLKELIQTAAMCYRAVEDLRLINSLESDTPLQHEAITTDC
jgi:hypothetical protein